MGSVGTTDRESIFEWLKAEEEGEGGRERAENVKYIRDYIFVPWHGSC